MIKILNSNKKNFSIELNKLLNKRRIINKSHLKTVQKIINNVKKNKENFLIQHEKKFNNNSKIIPSKNQIKKAIKSLDPKVKKAIDDAHKKIKEWHSKQKIRDIYYTDAWNNKFFYRTVPLDSCALYIPQNLPSALLMTATPAIQAGVPRIVVLTPSVNGALDPAVYYAASKLKISEIYAISGASAVAAVAYGTKKIKPVSKIIGAGSIYTCLAKKLVSLDGVCATEAAFLGPSEIVIWADNSVTAEEVVSSCIAQSEHDKNSMAILVTKSKKLIKEVKISMSKQLKDLPRKTIAQKSLKNNGALIYASSNKQILNIISIKYGDLVDVHLHKNPETFLEDVTSIAPDIVGLSFYYWNTNLNKEVTSRIRGQYGSKPVIVWGGPSVDSDHDELERLFERFTGVDAYVINEGELGFASVVESALGDLISPKKRLIEINEIQKTVSKYYGITVSDLISNSRKQHLVRARQMAIYLCHNLTALSLSKIGQNFGNRDHSTVLYSCEKVKELMKTNEEIKNDFENIKIKITNL